MKTFLNLLYKFQLSSVPTIFPSRFPSSFFDCRFSGEENFSIRNDISIWRFDIHQPLILRLNEKLTQTGPGLAQNENSEMLRKVNFMSECLYLISQLLWR